LAITECEAADLAVLLGNSDFRIYTIERDLELEGLILSHASSFWHEHVLGRTPPKPINSKDAAVLFPKESPALSVEADPHLIKSIDKYQAACEKVQTLSDECERLKLEIMNYMGHAEKLTYQGKTIATWKCAKSSSRIDTKALAKAHPEIAANFSSKVMGSRRFLLKGAA
jgi:predicted phage-related endonuclease